MQRSAEVLIVGGGVIGVSIAFHLARLGMRDVVLVDRGWLGCQATGQSGALVRTHYTNPHEARLALAGLRQFEQWGDLVGGVCGFVRTAFLQIVGAHDRVRLHENVRMLEQQVGVTTQLVNAAQVIELQPGLTLREDEQAAFEPDSGYADPLATVYSLAEAARRLGATLIEKEAVTNIIVNSNRVEGVETVSGRISAAHVVLANGGWAGTLAKPIGIELPIRPVLSQIAMFQRAPNLPRGPKGHLTLIDRAHGYYARPDGEELTLVGLSGLSRDLGNYDDGLGTYDLEVPGRARTAIASRMPGFKGARFIRKQSGPLDVTPDRCAILGASPIEGLFLAVGMSGSGFKKAPAIGACIAELITKGAAETAPIEPFRYGRFAEHDLIVGNDYAPLISAEMVTPH
jgi:sarcosine oxidase, subunit beta